jgi:transcriptional regulator GlxA family with amidase domain
MFDQAPMFDTSVPVGVFGADCAASGAPKFRLLPVAGEPGMLTSTGGVQLRAPHALDALRRAGVVIAPSWRSRQPGPPEPLLRALRQAHGEGALIAGLGSGVFVLAAAGLLDGRKVAASCRHAPGLMTAYPGVTVDPEALFIDDGDVVTSAGPVAGVDACLHIVQRMWGADAAAAIACGITPAVRPDGGRAPVAGGALDEAVAYALGHLDDTLDVGALAMRAHLSRRTFDRRFRAAVGASPLQWLGRQRILRAQRLLEDTDLTVEVIARQVGFTTAVSLRRLFRRVSGVSPQDYRSSLRDKAALPLEPAGRSLTGDPHPPGAAGPAAPRPGPGW